MAAESKDLLDLNVIDALVEAWKKYVEIKEYSDPKKYKPSEEILVPLATHTVKSEHNPYVPIFLKEGNWVE